MANKQKTGLNYFPMEVNLFSDIKIRKLIKYKTGSAVAVYLDILCAIYKNGYYLKWDKDLPFTLAETTGMSESFINEVISCCFDVGLFSEKLFNNSQVLTSKGIQERYVLICKQLKRTAIITEYLVNSSEEIKEIQEENQLTTNQSDKGKERKGNKKKEKKIEVKENIHLTTSEIEKFKSEFGETEYLEYVDHLSKYKIEKGYKTKDDNLTIRRWVIDAVNERKNKKNDTAKKNIGDRTQPGGFGSL